MQEARGGGSSPWTARSLAMLFFRRGFRLTGGICSTWLIRFWGWGFPDGSEERSNTGDMSNLVDRRSLTFLVTAASKEGKN